MTSLAPRSAMRSASALIDSVVGRQAYTAPTRLAACSQNSCARPFGRCKTRRSPTPTPRSRSARAATVDRTSSSAYVIACCARPRSASRSEAVGP
eukprot:scaffold8862_cov122-Isochrysis_galbana.AAC.8